MTDITLPGETGASIRSTPAGYAWEKAGTGAWIVDGEELAHLYTELDGDVPNGFEYLADDGLTVTIDGGEAYVAGWLCRDRQTEVSLPSDSRTTVYVGYDSSAALVEGESAADSENIIIGTADEFATEDPKVALYDFDTDSQNVIGNTDLRLLQQPIQYDDVGGDVTIVPPVSLSDTEVNGTLDVYGLLDVRDHIELRHVASAGGGANFVSGQPLIDLQRNTGSSTRGVHITFGNEEQSFHLFGSETDFSIYNDAENRVSGWDQSGNFDANNIDVGDIDGGDVTATSVDASGGAVSNVHESGNDAVSSSDVMKIHVSSSEPDDSDPHLWCIPE